MLVDLKELPKSAPPRFCQSIGRNEFTATGRFLRCSPRIECSECNGKHANSHPGTLPICVKISWKLLRGNKAAVNIDSQASRRFEIVKSAPQTSDEPLSVAVPTVHLNEIRPGEPMNTRWKIAAGLKRNSHYTILLLCYLWGKVESGKLVVNRGRSRTGASRCH